MHRNFLIVGTQRTGSQALWNAFNLHPGVVCGGEWTLHVPSHRKLSVAQRALSGDFLDLVARHPEVQKRLANAFTPNTQWLGFKILFRSSDKWIIHPRLSPALFLDRLEGHIMWLRSRPDIHIVHLIRREPIDWLKSKYMSRASGVYTNKQYPAELKIVIPEGKALRAVRAKAWVDRRLATLADSNPYYRIYYEDFLMDNRGVLAASMQFLGCDIAKLPDAASFKQRQSTGSAADYLLNHAQLVTALERNDLLVSRLCDRQR